MWQDPKMTDEPWSRDQPIYTEAGQKALEMFSRDQNKDTMTKYMIFKNYSGKKFVVKREFEE